MEYAIKDDGFYPILGSQLGNVAMNMLLDHKSEIGYKYVDRFVLFGRTDMPTGREWGPAKTFLIILSEPRVRIRAHTEVSSSLDIPLRETRHKC